VPDETEVTQSVPPPADAPPPPPPAPPGFVLRDAWPWFALLGILAVAGILLWLFVLRDRNDKGPPVPAVVGLPQQQAVAELTGRGFNVKIVIGPAKGPRGIVVSQIPGGGTRLDPGQTVTLHVSNGHPVTTATTPTTTTTETTTTVQTTTASSTQTTPAATAPVPDVVGQDGASGAGQVEAAGFVAQTDPVSASGPPGSIVQEDPAAGTVAKVGSVVRLGVAVGSNRPAVQVPNVVGQKAAAARAALLAEPLTVRTEYKKGPAKSIGVVLSQSPAAGGTAPAYTQVAIVVGS
jgi:eukaryotic-like serine/threonine-protein kinase